MFQVNDDLSIYVTRGDMVFLRITAQRNGSDYTFEAGEVLRIKVFGKKDAETVVLQKDFPVTATSAYVDIILTEEDTKIGDVISKPKDYWYEVELNPYDDPMTIIGYDADGAKIFRLYPEGADIPEYEPDPEVIKVIDTELDMTSERPVQNQVIARAFANLQAGYQAVHDAVAELYVTPQMFGAVGDGVADDTEALQMAIDYATEKGTLCHIPSGVFCFTHLRIKSNIIFEGEGKTISCLKHIGEGEAITVKPVGIDDWLYFLNVTLKNFKVEGNENTAACVRISECIHSHFESIYISGGAVGLFIDGSTDIQDNKNSVFNNEYKCISLVNCTEIGLKIDGIISDSHFENLYAENCPICADMTSVSTHNVSFTNGSFIICEKAFYIHGLFNNVRIETFNIEQFSSHGIHIVGDGINQCKNYTISNCLFLGNTAESLCVEASKFANSVIWNNNAMGTTETHIKLATGCLGVMLMNNQKNSGAEVSFVYDIPATCVAINYVYDKQDTFKVSTPIKLDKVILGNVTLVDSSDGHSEIVLTDPYSIAVKKGGYRTYLNPALTTTERLALSAPHNGSCVFDTTLGKPVWRANDAYWVDATGAKAD